MKSCEGQQGRIFMIRLEDGDILPDCIERFAEEKGVSTGYLILVGGIRDGNVVVGPEKTYEMPPQPVLFPIHDAHEIAAVGILAPEEDGKPVLHIHAALGRAGKTTTGCLRPGVTTWLVGEAILYEINGAKAMRVKDPESGFALLEIGTGANSGI